MEVRPLFQALHALAEDNAAFFGRSGTEAGRRFVAAFGAIRQHARRLEPALRHFARLYHRFDLDEATPGNGYRSLVHTACCCLAHVVHKSRYVATHRRSIFFRSGHNAAELEAYGAALAQLRALLCLAQRLLAHNRPGCLFPHEDGGISELVLREYSTMHNGCFYGRCLGFQFAPSIRPFLQTIAIGLVSFGENYKRDDMGLGVAAGSLFTSGKFAVDPELRGAEFERLTQNLDVHFWKSFWNLTETQLLASVASLAAAPVRLSWALTVPPEPLELPLAADPARTVTIPPPVAHTGPGPVHMRLLSYELREGQDSAALSALAGAEASSGWRRGGRGGRPEPPSPALLVHFHGGGFVAQTSRSHEPYLRAWARELGAPVLSVDYALAPEAPFPRALEECFYAYCWALRHCRLLGSTGQRVCLAGDSAGGNLCLTVSLRAAAARVQCPDGVVAAYPVTMVQAAVSPSRLLSLLDPLLPLGVLCQCLGAYAGAEASEAPALEKLSPGRLLRRDTALLLRDLRRGAAAWLGALRPHTRSPPEPVRKSVSEAAPAEEPRRGSRSRSWGEAPGGCKDEDKDTATGDEDGDGTGLDYPDDFEPLRSHRPPANFAVASGPLARNPYVSPLLAPDAMLQGLPPVHIVACALDPMLDDSVMFARRLRELGRPVTLRVVPDLPHGFLSLAQLCPETRQAAALCTRLIADVLRPPTPRRGPPGPPARRSSLLPAPRRGSQAPSRRGSLQPGERCEASATVTHGAGSAVTHGGGAAVTHGTGAAETHGGSSAVTHSAGAAETHSASAPATHGGGTTHGSGNSVTHGGGATHDSSNTVTHSSGAMETHDSSNAATHGSGAAETHDSSNAATHGGGAALPHSTSNAVTHGGRAPPPPSSGDAPMHSSSNAPTHGSGSAGAHGPHDTLTHSTGAEGAWGSGNALTHSASTAMTHGARTTSTHSSSAAPPPHSAAVAWGSGAQPPPCCGGPPVGGGGGPSPPGPPPGWQQGRGGSARRPSGPAGREVGS